MVRISFERQKKQKKGGQSQARIGRLRMERIDKFANDSIDIFNIFRKQTEYKSVIVAGNGSVLQIVKNHGSLRSHPDVIFVKVSDSNLLFSKCEEATGNDYKLLDDEKIDKYMEMVRKNDERLVYGELDINENKDLVKEIIIHKNSPYYEIFKNFKNKYVIRSCTRKCDLFLKNYDGVIGLTYYKINHGPGP